MPRRTLLLPLLTLLLISCNNLSASLLQQKDGGAPACRIAVADRTGAEQVMIASIAHTNGTVTDMTITAETSGIWRAHMLAFAANIRQFVLHKHVASITLPEVVGQGEEAKTLTQAFQTQCLQPLVDQLK